MIDSAEKDDGRTLWRRLRPAPSAHGSNIDPLDLAAWLDGTLDERTRARVDAALLADPDLLETALAARGAIDAPAQDTNRLEVRARALVAPQVLPVRSRAGWLGWIAAPRRLQWTAIGAAFVIAGVGGFNLGDTMAQEIQAIASQQSGFVYGMPLNTDPFAAIDDDEA